MKKRILLLGLVITLALGMCSCGKSQNTEPKEQPVTKKMDSGNYMEEHIKSIAPENRAEFLSFWQMSISYCKIIAFELKNMGNTQDYSFDPTDESQIPEEISELYDFSELSEANMKNLHKNFKMEIKGAEVSLSYDGIDIYPTEYAYSDIQDIIDSLK